MITVTTPMLQPDGTNLFKVAADSFEVSSSGALILYDAADQTIAAFNAPMWETVGYPKEAE